MEQGRETVRMPESADVRERERGRRCSSTTAPLAAEGRRIGHHCRFKYGRGANKDEGRMRRVVGAGKLLITHSYIVTASCDNVEMSDQ